MSVNIDRASNNETNKLSNELNRDNDGLDENDINIEFEEEKDVSNDFLILLRSMVDKLPPPLTDPIEGIDPLIEQIKDKEFCYKFLYSMKNNPANKNPVTNKIYNNIIDYYGIGERSSPQTPPFNLENGIIREPQVPLTKEEVSNIIPVSSNTTIQFEDGFVVSIVAPQKGGATQKRKKKSKRKEKYYTIKRR